MAKELTGAEVESLHQSCQKMLGEVLFSNTEARVARHLDADPLLVNIAWKILVPLVVSITGSLTSEAVKKLLFKSKDEESAETQVKTAVGKKKSTISNEELELCVQMTAEIIKQYAGTKKQAEKIVKALAKEIKEGKKQDPKN